MEVLEDIAVAVFGGLWYYAVLPGAINAPLGLGAIIVFQESRQIAPRIAVLPDVGAGADGMRTRRDSPSTRFGIALGWKFLLWLALATTATVAVTFHWEPTTIALVALAFITSWIYGDLRRARYRHADLAGITLLMLPYVAVALAILLAGASDDWPQPFGLLDHRQFDWLWSSDAAAAGKVRLMLASVTLAIVAIAGAWTMTRSERPPAPPLLIALGGIVNLAVLWTTLPAGMAAGTATVVMVGYALAREVRAVIAEQERRAAVTTAAVQDPGPDSTPSPQSRDAAGDRAYDHHQPDRITSATFRYRRFARRPVDVRQLVGIVVLVGAVWFALAAAWLWGRDPLNDPEFLLSDGGIATLGLSTGTMLVIASLLLAWNRLIIRYGALLLGFTIVAMNEALTGYPAIALLPDNRLDAYSIAHSLYLAIAAAVLTAAMWWAFGPNSVQAPESPRGAAMPLSQPARVAVDLGIED